MGRVETWAEAWLAGPPAVALGSEGIFGPLPHLTPPLLGLWRMRHLQVCVPRGMSQGKSWCPCFPKLNHFKPSGASLSIFSLLLFASVLLPLCVFLSGSALLAQGVAGSLYALCPSLSLRFLGLHGPGQVPPLPRCLVAIDCAGW